MHSTPLFPRIRVVLMIAVALVAVLAAARLPLHAAAVGLVEWIRGAGAAGVLVFAVAYVVATVAMLPGLVLTLGAGFAYGPVVGTLVVSPVSVAAATCALLLGRTLARDRVARRVAGRPRRMWALRGSCGGADSWRRRSSSGW